MKVWVLRRLTSLFAHDPFPASWFRWAFNACEDALAHASHRAGE